MTFLQTHEKEDFSPVIWHCNCHRYLQIRQVKEKEKKINKNEILVLNNWKLWPTKFRLGTFDMHSWSLNFSFSKYIIRIWMRYRTQEKQKMKKKTKVSSSNFSSNMLTDNFLTPRQHYWGKKKTTCCDNSTSLSHTAKRENVYHVLSSQFPLWLCSV